MLTRIRGNAVNQRFAAEVPARKTRWNRNIIAGVNRSTYPNYETTTFNRCNNRAANTLCDPEAAFEYDDPAIGPHGKPDRKLFVNFRKKITRSPIPWTICFQIAKRGGSDGRDIGVDYSQLPILRNFQIMATDREALLTYDITAQ